MKSQLEQLRRVTKIVVDSGEILSIKEFKPEDATTNPTLILKACKLPEYQNLVDDALEYGRKHGSSQEEKISNSMDKLLVNFGLEILKIIPGRISTEIDVRMSFDIKSTIDKARKIIDMYEQAGIKRERVLIKIASTWEGIQAARELEKNYGIHCNMTLIFSLVQAIAAAEAGVTLISPFCGRILDWHKKVNPNQSYDGLNDPGVQSISQIFNYYKCHDYKTVVMGASFRNVSECVNLAGLDLLTISPVLLKELSETYENIEIRLTVEAAKKLALPKIVYDEKGFRWHLNEDAMATEKLPEGCRIFAQDTRKMEEQIKLKL